MSSGENNFVFGGVSFPARLMSDAVEQMTNGFIAIDNNQEIEIVKGFVSAGMILSSIGMYYGTQRADEFSDLIAYMISYAQSQARNAVAKGPFDA